MTTPPPQDPFPPPPGGQPGPPSDEQPQYGQPAYGQPQYGQPQYGQPAYGQPQPQPQPQYGQPAYGRQQYGQPQVGYAVAPPTEGKAVAALVLAIISFVLLPIIPAIVALFLAASARRDIDASAGRLGGAGLVTAAKIISWVNLGVFLLLLGLFVLVFSVAGVASTPISTPISP